jgi:hypothetical protein
MANRKARMIAAHVNNEFTGHTASARVIAEIAARIVDEAGSAGGVDEVTAIARNGWASDLQLDSRLSAEDEGALRGAIQYAAQLETAEGT